jgi:hypothetical protein
MYYLTFTLEDGTTRNDFSWMSGTLESVKMHFENMIKHGQNNHPFMGREYADCVSVVVEWQA